MNAANKHKIALFLHILTGLTLVLKGFDKISHEALVAGGVILVLGLIVLGITFLGSRLHISHSKAQIISCFLEGVALVITGVVFYQDGKKYLPYIFFLSAFLFIVAAIFHIRKSKQATHYVNPEL